MRLNGNGIFKASASEWGGLEFVIDMHVINHRSTVALLHLGLFLVLPPLLPHTCTYSSLNSDAHRLLSRWLILSTPVTPRLFAWLRGFGVALPTCSQLARQTTPTTSPLPPHERSRESALFFPPTYNLNTFCVRSLMRPSSLIPYPFNPLTTLTFIFFPYLRHLTSSRRALP